MGDSERRRQLWKAREENGLCIYCGRDEPGKQLKGCISCLERRCKAHCKHSAANPEKARIYRSKIRQEAIKKYGGHCVCCGEAQWQFLAIDHKNKDGSKERMELYGRKSGASYSWFLKLVREPIRQDLQILCHNCNNAIHQFGICPHCREMKSKLRQKFREAVFERDGFKCRMCGKNSELAAHHIYDRHDMPNGGYVKENGVSLCGLCHFEAEGEHRGVSTRPGYSRRELYELIGTTFDEAWNKSEALG